MLVISGFSIQLVNNQIFKHNRFNRTFAAIPAAVINAFFSDDNPVELNYGRIGQVGLVLNESLLNLFSKFAGDRT